MRKFLSESLLLILCLCMILPFAVSCADKTRDDESSDIQNTETEEQSTYEEITEETTEEETVIVPEDSTKADIKLVQNGKFAYRIVRDNKASGELKSKINEFRSFLQDSTGKSVEYRTSSSLLDQNVLNNDYEILIGKTVRAASKALVDKLAPRDYFLGVFENKVIIIGGSDGATQAALEYFMTDILSQLDTKDEQAKITMARGYFYRYVYIGADMKIGDTDVSKFDVKYFSGGVTDKGLLFEISNKIISAVEEYNGSYLDCKFITSSTEAAKNEILVGPVGYGYAKEYYAKKPGTMDYSAKLVDGSLYICGGGEWAMSYVADQLVENYISKGLSIPNGFELTGTLYGEQLFELENDSNLRIMANNVWDNDNNNTYWANMGENCSAEMRAKGFVACYLAFRPDVINFQEMSTKMLDHIIQNFADAGYNYAATETIKHLNIIYNTETLTLVEHGYHIFTYGSNSESKGYAWALFEHKDTGERFISVTTHFWWMSESAQIGSNKYRERQANEAADKCLELAVAYNCPVFIGGDFNASTSSQAMKNIIDKGMLNAFGTALESDDLGSHHNYLGPNGVDRGSAGNNGNAIDHMFYCNLGDATLNSFRRTQPYFFIKLSDHYPLYVDVTLK